MSVDRGPSIFAMTSQKAPRQFVPAVLAVALLVVGSQAASAAPCLPGALSDYLALGGGCSIGSVQFANFELFPLPNSATLIPTDAITVSPLASASNVGLLFTLDVEAEAGELFEVLFGYDVSGAAVNRADLVMTGATASGDAAITAVQDLCVGAVFDFGIGCPGQHEANIAFAIQGITFRA
jgi:hypothetical protein